MKFIPECKFVCLFDRHILFMLVCRFVLISMLNYKLLSIKSFHVVYKIV